MGERIQNTSAATPRTSDAVPTTGPDGSALVAPAEPEEQADQAAADLDALSAAHQRRPPPRRRRRSRPELSPERVARRFVEVEVEDNPARLSEADRSRFLEAMVPAERTEFMEQLAGKLADVAVGHIQGAVETFNSIRDHFNARRLEAGEAELPHVDLNSQSMRTTLQAGIEHGLDAGVRLVLETALHTIFGEPSRLPQTNDAASSLDSLPELEELDTIFNLHWSQPF